MPRVVHEVCRDVGVSKARESKEAARTLASVFPWGAWPDDPGTQLSAGSTYTNNVLIGIQRGCMLGGAASGLLFAHNLCFGGVFSGLRIQGLFGDPEAPVRLENNIIDVGSPSTALEFWSDGSTGTANLSFRNNDFRLHPTLPNGWQPCIAKHQNSDAVCITDPNTLAVFGHATAIGNVSIVPDYVAPNWETPEIAGFAPAPACALRARGSSLPEVPIDILGTARGAPSTIGPFECQ